LNTITFHFWSVQSITQKTVIGCNQLQLTITITPCLMDVYRVLVMMLSRHWGCSFGETGIPIISVIIPRSILVQSGDAGQGAIYGFKVYLL